MAERKGPVSYQAFRTGLTYSDVYWMLWSGDPDPSTWRYKSRGVVLGKWRQMKREMYEQYVAAVAGNDNKWSDDGQQGCGSDQARDEG